jgi:Protein of unknown function (DUF1592)/Protein of unknown function (DUF1588)/Protein of unknown function (DUF1587)/Protein of unknown function (DUF1595)/Cellulose binding domain/Protein of unknown function (DUF1585)
MRTINVFNRNLGALLLGAAALTGSAAACSGGKGSEDSGGAGGGASAGCADDLQFFEANIYKPILAQKCAVCHGDGGLAKGTRMVLRPASEAGYLEKNFEMVKKLAATQEGDTSLLLLKPSNKAQGGHIGGKVIPFDSPEYHTFQTFVARVTEGKECDSGVVSCAAPAPGPRLLRRLSRSEYDATIHDLFGIESTWGASFTSDVVINGFDNNAAALRVSPLLADQTRKAAEAIAKMVLASPGQNLPCDVATGDAACAGKLIDSLGKRIFRRPLLAEDHARYLALYTLIAKDDGFAGGAEAVITAMLQSPSFLYRTELGDAAQPVGKDAIKLTPYEVASELSYFLWGTMPDATLFAAADAGELSTPAQIEKQARRLLADPQSRATIQRFVEAWLEIDRLPNIPKDAATYPELDAAARVAQREETRRFVTHVMEDGTGTLPELLTSRTSYLSPELAKLYGLPEPSGPKDAAGFAETTFDGKARAGILTQGSVITTHSKPSSSSPIHRGKLVRERLLCQPLPPPPAGLMVQPPPLDPSLTTRERYAAHATVEPCASCHRLIDPIGFGFERFDGIGRERDSEAGHSIDASGQILSTPGSDGKFDGTMELATKLAASPDVHACFATQWLRFAYGIEESAETACLVEEIGQTFEKDGLKIEDLIVSLTLAPRFAQRSIDDGVDGGTSSGSGAGGGMSTGVTTGSGSSTAASSSSGGPVMADLDVEKTTDSQWATGYQMSIKVTNKSAAKITWSITIPVEGKITDLWNANSAPAGAQTTFTGKDFNATLDPGASASFGFVATK